MTAVPNAAGRRCVQRSTATASGEVDHTGDADPVAAADADPPERDRRGSASPLDLGLVIRGNAHDDARRHLVERFGHSSDVDDVDAATRVHGHLGDAQREATVRDVVRAHHDIVGDHAAHDREHPRVHSEIERRRADAGETRTGLDARTGRTAVELLDDAEQAHDGRRRDVVARRLVVEADVASDDGDVEGAARFAHPVDRLGQLPHDLGMLRVAEVQAVDERERTGGDARKVRSGLGHDHRSAEPGIVRAPTVVAVGGERKTAPGVVPGDRMLQAQNGCVGARPLHGVEEQLMVVLRPDPRVVGEEVEQVRLGVVDVDQPDPVSSLCQRRSHGRRAVRRHGVRPRARPRSRRPRRGSAVGRRR